MINARRNFSSGSVDRKVVALGALVLLVIAMGGLAGWAVFSYQKLQTEFESKLALGEAEANKKQADIYAELLKKSENAVVLPFAGPEDYGRLTFKYPKTWSVYVANDVDAGGGKYLAYLNPVMVPPVSGAGTKQFALRVTIAESAYEKELASYKALIQKGELKSQPIKVNDHEGTRLDGTFSKDIRGAAVLFRIRDKTATIQTDANTFLPTFDEIVKTIDFNS